ncbi:hypothetical protein L2E82_39803 [Cichorium intybus]|uniref:Uncharacterized protein n=1 Tax=Cichorium intybus TaxID=13427 RepID=A0ACB9AJB0_CICIN|nr:hypothetical protein L2E82_39803 [Cichorium intybus]
MLLMTSGIKRVPCSMDQNCNLLYILYGICFFWHISSINTPVGLPVSVTRLILIGLLSGAQAETKGSTSRIYSYTFGKSSCT